MAGVDGAGPISFVAPLEMESPCVNVCQLDATRRHCTGCGRTTDEIAHWTSATPEWRRAIMAELPARREKLALPHPRRP